MNELMGCHAIFKNIFPCKYLNYAFLIHLEFISIVGLRSETQCNNFGKHNPIGNNLKFH